MKRFFRIIVISLMLLASSLHVKAVSFALDSIAEWGRFPHFCVDVYRWGDKFFNSYDSLYVVGTGYKFNVKLKSQSWTDYYNFNLPNEMDMMMTSDASNTIGAYVTYLAVSAGYDININKLGGAERTRSRFNFGFNCSLLAVEWSYVSNDVGTTIKRIGERGTHAHTDIPFDGINNSEWALETYYFFNHKKYSQAAAFNFSKIQRRSQGSLYAGISIYAQDYDFDFSSLNEDMLSLLPDYWPNYHYKVKTHNYGLRVGYGYNWVVGRNWIVCGSFSPTIGVRKGYINSETEKTTFSLYDRIKASAVWNHDHWFIGVVGKADISLVSERKTMFVGANISLSAAVGYRFNLW